MYFTDDYAINLAHVMLVQRNSNGTTTVMFVGKPGIKLVLPPEHFHEMCEAMRAFNSPATTVIE